MANRLAGSSSPYLLQHADNPVDWWEWSDDAFAEAAGIDVDAARAWSLLRAGVEVSWTSELSDPEALSTCIALTKALDD